LPILGLGRSHHAKAYSTPTQDSRSPCAGRATPSPESNARAQTRSRNDAGSAIGVAEFKPTAIDVVELDFVNDSDEVLADDAAVTGFEDEDL